MSTAAVSVPRARAKVRHASLRRSRRWALFASYFFLVMFAIFFLIPPYYMIVTSLKTDAEVAHMATNPWIIANGVTLDQFKILLTQTDFLIYFKNTAIVTVCVVIITMVVSVLAAFSLGRMKFWGSGILATGIFLTYLVPDTLLFIPLFQIVKAIGLLNSYWGMVLVYPTLTVPFCTWIMIGYFQSIPKELDEAALIDGAGHQHSPFIDVATDQAGHGANGKDLLVGRVKESHRIDEGRPRHGEGEDHRRDDSGQRHRDEYLEQHLHVAGAVDQRRLIQFFRDRLEIADHDPGAERHRQSRIDQHHAPIGIE
jgi:ABC-type maltose transport system permease subunit